MNSIPPETNIEISSPEEIKTLQKKLIEQGRRIEGSYLANIKDGKRNIVNGDGEIKLTIPTIPIKHYQTHYIVSYASYMYGDFIQWLINQHNNFPHWQKMQIRPFSPVSHEISWPYVTMKPKWLYFLDDLSNIFIASDVARIGDGRSAEREFAHNDDKNYTVSKFASKIYTKDFSKIYGLNQLSRVGHPQQYRNAPFQTPDEIGHTVSAEGLEKIRAVVPNTKCIQLQIEDLGSDAFHTYTKRTSGDSQRILMILDDLELPDFVLYVDKIFALDDGEYKRLLDFIEEDPIDNWKERVKIYTERVVSI